MSRIFVSRRKVLTGAAAFSGLLLSGCDKTFLPPHRKPGLGGLAEQLNMAAHRLFMTKNSLAPEFGVQDITKHFPVEGQAYPEDEDYRRLLHGGFADWALEVKGLVNRPIRLTLDEVKRLPSRTQITQHSCEKGWTAIAQWTGVQVSRLLQLAGGVKPDGRYVVFKAFGGGGSFDLFDATHQQTILAYGMNGRELPIPHGAPLRLRMERHVGYAHTKFVSEVEVVDRPGHPGDSGWHWYTGA
jgi:DMSO/TMAO reductase YedYZ molybdopterin-dependent catalytic subunit